MPSGHLRREDVLAVLSAGPPAFLQTVDVEPVTTPQGRFAGWRVVALNAPGWSDGDVKPGDVVTRVNNRDIETPAQFFEVFQSLAFAPALSVAVERSGQRIELRYPIDDDPSSAATRPQRDASSAPKPGASVTSTQPPR